MKARSLQMAGAVVLTGVFFALLWLPGYALGHVSDAWAWVSNRIGAL